MPSQGPLNPTSTLNNGTVGTVDWSNLNNAQANDGVYATVGLGAAVASHYVFATAYGFTIPAGATILGITMTRGTQANLGGASGIVDNSVKALKGAALIGSEKATATGWGGSVEQPATYGGAADLWGTTWTVSDINSSNFGVAISAINNGIGSDIAELDYVQLSVTYSQPAFAPQVITVSRPPQATYQFLNPD